MKKVVLLVTAYIFLLVSCSKEQAAVQKIQEETISPAISTLNESVDDSMIDKFFDSPIVGSVQLGKDISIIEANKSFGKPKNCIEEVVKTRNSEKELIKKTYEYEDFSITWAVINDGDSEICISRIINGNSLKIAHNIRVDEGIEKIERIFTYPIQNNDDEIGYELNNESGAVIFRKRNQKLVQIELYRNIE